MAGEHQVEEGEIDMAEEHEVEEGEIYDDLHIDIDVKLQSVLGDYMKDFEGAVSLENLGQKFGVYGSFLPISSTVLFQPTTPHKSQKLPSPSRFSSQESIKFPVKHKVSLNPSYQTTLKLHSRVRIGYDRAKAARKSSDLHTGSTDSVDVSSKLIREICGDSPTNILQTFPIALLSPLPNKLLTLSKKSPHRQPTSGDKPLVSPFVIEGDWILCRECRKWRLLPYGTKPEQLSQSWLCSMLDWIPGMNYCDISEEETTRALHALYQSLIQSNFQNRGGKGSNSIDVKGHNGTEVSVKKRKLRDQDYLVTSQCNGNDLGESDANAFEREVSGGFKKQKKSKVKRESSTSKGEEKSRTREHQTKKHRVKHQSQAELSSMNLKQVCMVPLKKALGYGKVARPYIAYW